MVHSITGSRVATDAIQPSNDRASAPCHEQIRDTRQHDSRHKCSGFGGMTQSSAAQRRLAQAAELWYQAISAPG